MLIMGYERVRNMSFKVINPVFHIAPFNAYLD